MQKFKLLLLSVLVLLITSCNSYKDIRVEKIVSANLRELNGSTATVDVVLKVNNPTNSAVHLKKIDLDVFRKDSKFAHINVLEPVTVPAKSNVEKTLTLEVRLTNVLSSGFMLLSKKLKPEDFTANGYIKVSSFPFTKKIKIKNENLGTVLKNAEKLVSK